MKVEKVTTYTVTLTESEYKDVQDALTAKASGGTATPSQNQLLTEITQNL